MNNEQITITDKTIGEIVAENYHTAGVFRKHGIDFCCGGDVTLRDSCLKNKIDPEQLTNELLNLRTGHGSIAENYNQWSIDFLIDYIINTHHSYVRNKTDEILAYAKKVSKVHGRNNPENIEIYNLYSALVPELLEHLEAEETVVFPLIKFINKMKQEDEPIEPQLYESLKRHLVEMLTDHDGAGGIMASIRELSHDYMPPGYACTTYRILYQNLHDFEQDLHKHVHLENNILFKKAEKLLV